jgi:hypothetical protein
MKRVFLTIACVIVASRFFAQEVDLGLGGDASSLLNLPVPRGNTPARGNAPARGDARGRGAGAAPVDRLVRLRELFVGANIPLAKEQEAAVNSFLNGEIPAMRRTLQERIAELQKTKGGGAGPGNLPSMDELAPQIIRLNDQLLGKMATAPALSPEQQAFVKKLYQDQVKSRGGFDAIKLTLENAGAPFSAEQIAQIQPLFDEQNQAKLQLLKESQGQPPDKAKIDQVQRETLAKVIRLLTPAQRAALVAK